MTASEAATRRRHIEALVQRELRRQPQRDVVKYRKRLELLSVTELRVMLGKK